MKATTSFTVAGCRVDVPQVYLNVAREARWNVMAFHFAVLIISLSERGQCEACSVSAVA
jgi:hypothetical protein